jgi:2-phosphosulfolactate phosphatase
VTTPQHAAPRVDVEWGLTGARQHADRADVVVVVDVLSFSTAVTVACEQGVRVWPHPGGEPAMLLARSIDAVLAGTRSHGSGPSLSPASLMALQPGTRLVLPSPNGSTISNALMHARGAVLLGCLRNARAVAARAAALIGEGGRSRIAVIAAGERWSDGSLRVAYEDLVGAGAVVDRLVEAVPGLRTSPDADAAALAFRHRRDLAETPSGLELIERDFAADVEVASQVDVSTAVPVLRDGAFTPA